MDRDGAYRHNSGEPLFYGTLAAVTNAAAETLTVVIPVLNEASGLTTLLDELTPVLESTGCRWSVLFIDDGSTDATHAALLSLHDKDPRISAISLSRNFGKEIAVAAGLRYAAADMVVIMDGDLQHPPQVIPTFIAKRREGFDVVYGKRMNRNADSLWRKTGAKAFYAIFHALSGTSLQEDSCDFRLLSRRAVDAINRVGERARYNNGLFAWIGFPSIGVPFEMHPRPSGEGSRWKPLKLARLAIDGLATFSTVPLKISALLGFVVSIIAFIYMAIVLFKTIFFGDDVRGFPTLIITMLFFSGVQLIFLGIIGAYLGRVYEEVKARPLFLIRDEIGATLPDAGKPSAYVQQPRAS